MSWDFIEAPGAAPSKPLRFDRQSLAVRVTSENRWVVTVDQLKKETSYTLQLRPFASQNLHRNSRNFNKFQ